MHANMTLGKEQSLTPLTCYLFQDLIAQAANTSYRNWLRISRILYFFYFSGSFVLNEADGRVSDACDVALAAGSVSRSETQLTLGPAYEARGSQDTMYQYPPSHKHSLHSATEAAQSRPCPRFTSPQIQDSPSEQLFTDTGTQSKCTS